MTEKKELNLHQKLIEVRKQVKFLQKDAKGFNFTYTAGSSVLQALRPELDNQGILIITKMLDPEIREGNLFFSKIEYDLINADHPEDKLTIPWVAVGRQKDPSQSLGSALTYSERYLLTKLNLIPTDDDDPDALGAKDNGKPEPKPAPKPSSKPEGEKKFVPISPELIAKIKHACLYAADNNQEQAAKYYHLYADIMKDGKLDRAAPEVEKLSLKWAGNIWGKIKKMFEQNGWDIETALAQYREVSEDAF